MGENIHHLSGNLLVGSSHFYVDTTNNRVGITTADPQAGLHVNSNAYVHTDFRVGSGIVMNVTGGRITAGSFEGDGSLLENVPGDSGSWVKGSSSNVHLATLTDKVGIGTVSPGAELHVAGTGAIIVPTGPTENRPTTGVNGMIRYNSTIGNIEVYTAGVWTPLTQPPTITGISPLTTLFTGHSFSSTHTQKIIASDDAPNDGFGYYKAVSMSNDGNHIIIGAPGHNSDGGNDEKGAAYYFLKSGTGYSWSEQQILQPSDPLIDTNFGSSVAISGNGLYAAIGRCDTDSGNQAGNAVYIFKLESGSWVEKQKLGLPSGFHATASRFGCDVSLTTAGDCLIVGTGFYSGSNAPGGAVVYNRSSETWTKESALLSGSTVTADAMGSSVKISGDGNYAIVGALKDDDQGTDAGTAHIFKRVSATTWDSGFKIIGSDTGFAGYTDFFGFSVSIDSTGTYAIVGAYFHNAGTPGAAYIFHRSGSTNSWGQQADLVPTDIGSGGQRYGEQVEISPDGLTALIHSSDSAAVNNGGGVHRWTRSGSTWTEQATIRSIDAAINDRFGSGIACSSNAGYIVAGAWQDDDGGDRSGSAYIYHRVFDVSTQVFTVTGTGITTGSTVKLVGLDGTLYDVLDVYNPTGTQINFKMGALGTSGGFVVANQPYKVMIESASGLNVISTAQIGFPPTWTTAALTDLNFDAAVSGFQTIAGTDGGGLTTNRTFSVQSGNLPANLGLNQGTGVITGTATTPGTTQVEFRVVDTNTSLFVDRTFNIVVTEPWKIIMRTSGKKNSSGPAASFGNPGSSVFRSITASSTGASSRTNFGDAVGLYDAFFTKTGITKIALVQGDGNMLDMTSHSQYIIYDLVESSGSESLYDIIKRLDEYNRVNANWAGNGGTGNPFDSLFNASSVINFTAGTNGYSGTKVGSSTAGIATEAGVTPDKFCIWGINQDSDNDTQVLCAYSGTLASGNGKSDGWRGGQPKHSFWSYWGNDWHSSSVSQTIGSASQTSPGIGDSVSTYVGDIYLMAF